MYGTDRLSAWKSNGLELPTGRPLPKTFSGKVLSVGCRRILLMDSTLLIFGSALLVLLQDLLQDLHVLTF